MISKMTRQITGSNKMVGRKELLEAKDFLTKNEDNTNKAVELCLWLASDASNGITGRLISARWDNWREWPNHLEELRNSDLYTLRRITGRDRGETWGDK